MVNAAGVREAREGQVRGEGEGETVRNQESGGPWGHAQPAQLSPELVSSSLDQAPLTPQHDGQMELIGSLIVCNK